MDVALAWFLTLFGGLIVAGLIIFLMNAFAAVSSAVEYIATPPSKRAAQRIEIAENEQRIAFEKQQKQERDDEDKRVIEETVSTLTNSNFYEVSDIIEEQLGRKVSTYLVNCAIEDKHRAAAAEVLLESNSRIGEALELLTRRRLGLRSTDSLHSGAVSHLYVNMEWSQRPPPPPPR